MCRQFFFTLEKISTYENHCFRPFDVPHFCTNDPHGLMQSRVGAEIAFAAGLGCVCVGQTGQETIDLLVRYASDSNAQRKTLAFIAENRRDKKERNEKNKRPLRQ
jgi:hypothetical protein